MMTDRDRQYYNKGYAAAVAHGEQLAEQTPEATEALRKAILWGECLSQGLSPESRKDINWKNLEDCRKVLKKLEQPLI